MGGDVGDRVGGAKTRPGRERAALAPFGGAGPCPGRAGRRGAVDRITPQRGAGGVVDRRQRVKRAARSGRHGPDPVRLGDPDRRDGAGRGNGRRPGVAAARTAGARSNVG